MRNPVVLRIALAAVAASAGILAQETEVRASTHTVAGGPRAGQSFGYRLLVPPVEPGVRYPLALFLHGAGERGADNERQLVHLPAALRNPAPDGVRCFVLAPQCPDGERWVAAPWDADACSPMAAEPAFPLELALHLIERTVAEQPIDPDRIYATGLSMGGFGVWECALRRPELFAAVVPVCGGGDEALGHRLAALPLWAFHGALDRVVLPSRSRRMVDAVRRAGGDPRHAELPGVGHDAWAAAYGPDGAISWMLEQRRGDGRRAWEILASAASPVAKGARFAFLGDSITEQGAAPGGYVALIRAALAGRPDLETRVIPAGISGHRVPDLLARVQKDVLDHRPTAVFVYIGINDVWHAAHGRGTPIEGYAAGLADLLGRIRASGAIAVLATPSVIGERPSGRNDFDAELDRYAAASRRVAAAAGVPVCDLRHAFQVALRTENPAGRASGVFTTDGVHLNAAGNRLVARAAASALFEALAAAPRAK